MLPTLTYKVAKIKQQNRNQEKKITWTKLFFICTTYCNFKVFIFCQSDQWKLYQIDIHFPFFLLLFPPPVPPPTFPLSQQREMLFHPPQPISFFTFSMFQFLTDPNYSLFLKDLKRRNRKKQFLSSFIKKNRLIDPATVIRDKNKIPPIPQPLLQPYPLLTKMKHLRKTYNFLGGSLKHYLSKNSFALEYITKMKLLFSLLQLMVNYIANLTKAFCKFWHKFLHIHINNVKSTFYAKGKKKKV